MIYQKERVVIKTETLVAIRDGFKAHHKAHAAVTTKDAFEIDFDPVLATIPALLELVELYVTEKIDEAKEWLIDQVIKNAPIQITFKAAVVFVLTALDTLINGKETQNAEAGA